MDCDKLSQAKNGWGKVAGGYVVVFDKEMDLGNATAVQEMRDEVIALYPPAAAAMQSVASRAINGVSMRIDPTEMENIVNVCGVDMPLMIAVALAYDKVWYVQEVSSIVS